MRNLVGISLAALLVPFTACVIADSDSAPGESAPASAALGVTVSGLSLVSDNAVGSREWCVINVAAFNTAHSTANLVAGRQIRIWRPGLGNLGACTVRNDGNLATDEIRMSDEGLQRVEGTAGSTYTVSIDTVTATTQYPYSASSPPQSAATADEEFFEWRRSSQTAIPSAATIVAIAPHGGGIEQSTAAQARVDFYGALPSGRVVDWELYGYNKKNADAGDDHNAFDHWHITSTDIAPQSFPILDALVTHGFPYAVAFHGFGAEDFSAFSKHVFVGGGESALFRREIADVINTLSATVTGISAIYRGIPVGLEGGNVDNIVNRFNAGHRGLQLEQAWDLRGLDNSTNVAPDIATKVATVYACLTDDATALTPAACSQTVSVSGAKSSDECGRFVADTTIPSTFGGGFVLRGSLDVASLAQADCGTVKGYVSIYRQESGRFERMAGGALTGVWDGYQCATQVAAGDDPNLVAFITDAFSAAPPQSGADQYRITVTGTYGNDLPLTGVASLTRDEAPTCCATDADCTLAVDASSCTCTAVTVGTTPRSSGGACVINACRGKSAVCQAGQCAVASAPSY